MYIAVFSIFDKSVSTLFHISKIHSIAYIIIQFWRYINNLLDLKAQLLKYFHCSGSMISKRTIMMR